jgi:hypothetical protein
VSAYIEEHRDRFEVKLVHHSDNGSLPGLNRSSQQCLLA